jgi:hypothetical protein
MKLPVSVTTVDGALIAGNGMLTARTSRKLKAAGRRLAPRLPGAKSSWWGADFILYSSARALVP